MMTIDDLLRRSARLFPHTQAVVDARRSLSYAEFDGEVRRLATMLLSCGVQAGDRVAIVSRNRWEYAALYFAAAHAGAVLVPLNWRLNPAELRWILADADPRVVLAEPSFAHALDPHRHEHPGVRQWIGLDEPPSGWALLPALTADAPALNHAVAPGRAGPGLATGADAPLTQMYTSGTTGRPKGAVLTHTNMVAAMWGLQADFALRPGQDRFLQVTPLFHVGGALMVVACLSHAVTLRLLPEFEPGPAARCLATERITHTLMVPAMLRWLFAEPGMDQMRFPDLRLVAYGAAPMPVPLLSQAMEHLGCGFFQGYGLTETAGLVTILRPEDHVLGHTPALLARLASAGREMLGSQVRVVNPEGHDVRPGEVGEVVTRGPNVSPGYWQLPQATLEANQGGWFWTGDLGTLDDEGYLTIVDRAKDMIVVGGENVYPREVELVLADHPAVTDCAVIGIPHDVWGEEVLAFVAVHPGDDTPPRALIAHCRTRLARYKSPTRVEIVPAVPRNSAGKIEKALLREPYWAGRAKRV